MIGSACETVLEKCSWNQVMRDWMCFGKWNALLAAMMLVDMMVSWVVADIVADIAADKAADTTVDNVVDIAVADTAYMWGP